jgi:hypothetical protein
VVSSVDSVLPVLLDVESPPELLELLSDPVVLLPLVVLPPLVVSPPLLLVLSSVVEVVSSEVVGGMPVGEPVVELLLLLELPSVSGSPSASLGHPSKPRDKDIKQTRDHMGRA